MYMYINRLLIKINVTTATHGLIAQKVRASEQNSVEVGSNATGTIFLLLL